MLPFEDEYTRHRQLREIGSAGQKKLAASVAHVSAYGVGSAFAGELLTRSGVTVQCVSPVPLTGVVTQPDVSRLGLSLAWFEGPRETACGALQAIDHVRETLDLRASALRPGQ